MRNHSIRLFVVLLILALVMPFVASAEDHVPANIFVGQEDEECFEEFEEALMDYMEFDDLDELFDFLDSNSDDEIDAVIEEAGLMDLLMECEGDEPPDDGDDRDGEPDGNGDDDDDGETNPPSTDVVVFGELSFEVTSIPADVHPAFINAFEKYVNVFGIHLFATSGVSDAKLLHTANVMAQYLDNDADGQPDNLAVVEAMVASQAAMVVFTDDNEVEQIIDQLEPTFEAGILSQDLYATEIFPNGTEGEFDATLEEVLHLITHAGYAAVYPDIFGEESGSAVAEAMDVARGGHFDRPPSSYPAEAWYTYDDPTCDYNCQVTEYIYWSLTSILGAQEDRLDDIGNEWRLNTAEKVEETDSAIYEILTNPEYGLPTILPDGQYQVEESEE